jgi:hypothetical protein
MIAWYSHYMTEAQATEDWLLLAFQLPPRAGALRVRVWRRLQAIGAVPLGTALYALPERPACREDFEWLLRAIGDGGGEGTLVAGRLLAGVDAATLRSRLEAARDAEYRELAETLRRAMKARARGKAAAEQAAQELIRARRRLAEIEQRDFYGADARAIVAGLLGELEQRALGTTATASKRGAKAMKQQARAAALRGKTWVTRERVHVDRIACAWLIRRWIDPKARFHFVAGRDHAPSAGELRFDMFEAEYTHEGERCTFEVMLARFGLREPALRAIGEIVHDIDLKDARYARAETAGVAALLAGICRGEPDDLQRLARGGALFDDLYRQLGGTEPVR